jgi:hypothetical protein
MPNDGGVDFLNWERNFLNIKIDSDNHYNLFATWKMKKS